jgi:hypothetical protein
LNNNDDQIAFARSYVNAFDRLANQLRDRGESKSDVRKEVADRANMSDGATAFLVRLLDKNSQDRHVLSDRLGVKPETLQQEFFRGIALLEARECYRCVGKVHIADMLLEALQQWPEAPSEGILRSVVDATAATVATGDKKKALALLDAIEACQDLEAQGLDAQRGFGQQLARRLSQAALAAADSRAYHPTRAIHDRLLRIIASGVQPGQELFPSAFADSYVRGTETATSETSRLALGRYATLLEQLNEVGVSRELPQVNDFLHAMKAALTESPNSLKLGVESLLQTIGEVRKLEPDERARRVAQRLDEVIQQLHSQ